MQIIAAFPGTGKSHFADKYPHISDSDSSHFDKRYFPGNYLDHIQARYDRGLCTFVSSHALVREGLVKRGLPFMLVYPEKRCKGEYLERYRLRGNSESFIQLLDSKWDEWLDECDAQENCHHLEIGPGMFMSDAIQWGFSLK